MPSSAKRPASCAASARWWLRNANASASSRYGMVTMCVGGGQGAATILENLQ